MISMISFVSGNGMNVPCQFEADYYCQNMDDIVDIMACLESQDPTKLSFSCSPLVRGYELCDVESGSSGSDSSSSSSANKKQKPAALRRQEQRSNQLRSRATLEMKTSDASFDLSKNALSKQRMTGISPKQRVLAPKKSKQGPKPGPGTADDDDGDATLPCWARSTFNGQAFLDPTYDSSNSNPSLILIGKS